MQTPKTLLEAIQNGITESKSADTEVLSHSIRRHVRDFLSQRFSVALFNEDDETVLAVAIYKLWHAIKK